MTSHYIIPIFVPHLGCPHDCVFCNQKKITNEKNPVDENYVKEIIETYLGYFNKKAFIEVAFYGGSFTAIEKELQKELLKVPQEYKKAGKINAIRMSTRPDAIDEEIIQILKDFDVDTVELGVQSMDEDVLNKSGRGHDAACVYKSVKSLKDAGINCGLQMMLGLPGDNLEKALYTTKEFIDLDPFCIRIYPTLIIKETYLETLYEENKYKALSVDEAIEQTKIILTLFELNNINVIRVGLQVTDNIQLGKDVVSGPFHPSFRQLVESDILKDIIDEKMKTMNIMNNHETVIYCDNRNISNVAGQKSKNIKFLKNKYGIRNLKIHGKANYQNYIKLVNNDIEIEIDIENEKIKLVEKLLKETSYELKDFNIG